MKIWQYLANEFNNECLADEILSFSVEMACDYDEFENFTSYPFMISLPGLRVHLSNDWKTQLQNCLSINLDVW